MQKDSHSIILTKSHADDLRPILKWIKTDAPRKNLRIAASSLLTKTEGIKEWKQLNVSMNELNLIRNIHESFPEGSIGEGKQGRLKGF